MKVFIFLFTFILSGAVNAQNKDDETIIDHETLQRVFNQISILESEIPNQGFKGALPGCDFFILINEFITDHEKYTIDEYSICPVDRSVIFQLNHDFLEIESVKK